MGWSDKVFRYCERGADPGFLGEPLNALTNAAFLIGAILAGMELARRRTLPQGLDDSPRTGVWLLVALVFVIGIGSFLFHTFATRWSAVADVVPIGVFMLAYMGYALHAFLRLPWWAVVGGLIVFIAALYGAGQIECSRPGLLAVTAAARGPCLNGTLGYGPAFLALAGIGTWLAVRSHPASRHLLAAAGVFLVSMVFRTVDIEICALTRLAGRALGTHAVWHLLNATTLTLLLLAAIRHGRVAR